MSKLKRDGWVVITPTICQGDIMAAHLEDKKGLRQPDIYKTEDKAWKEIAYWMIAELQGFINGDRSREETRFDTDDYVAFYQEWENGDICISDDQGNSIIETTLQKWRENL